MTTTSEHLEALQTALNDLHDQVGTLSDGARAAADGVDATLLSRLVTVVGTVRVLLAETPAAMVTEAMLQGMDSHVASLGAQLPQLEADAPTAVAAIQSGVDGLVQSTAGWATLPPITGDQGEAIARTVLERVDGRAREFDSHLSRASKQLTETEKKIAGRLAELDVAITDSTARLETTVGEIQTKLDAQEEAVSSLSATLQTQATTQRAQEADAFKAAEDQRRQEFEALQHSLKQSADEEVEGLRQQTSAKLEALQPEFAKLQTSITNEKQRIDALVAEQQQQFGTLRTDWTKAIDTQSEEAEKKASELLEKIQGVLKKTEEVANAVAITGTATAYGKDAKEERKAADIWRWAAIVLGLIAAGVAAYTLIVRVGETGQLSTPAIVGRVLVTLAVGALASYAGRESAKHRKREVRSRKLELELTAFPPFVEGLDEAAKDRLRTELAGRLFQGATDHEGGENEAVIGQDQVTLFGNIIAPILQTISKLK